MSKSLAAFDFDHTIVDDNADTAVISLIDKTKITRELKDLHRQDGWTAFMDGIFNLLGDEGISQEQITSLIENLPPVEGITELIKELHKCHYDIIIISDCNTYFINVWLEKHQLKDYISKVFTNPGKFENGKLRISMFHFQTDCKLSTKNLCKGKILEDYISQKSNEGTIYDKIIYAGDGVNDFCPILRLRSNDLACVRNNYKCLELVRKAEKGECLDNTGKKHELKAKILVWDSGTDILKNVRQE